MDRTKINKYAETAASLGLLLVAVGLVLPILNLSQGPRLDVYKWVYGGGAFIFVIARMVGATDRSGSMRLRRLRRMEFWAGVALMFGAAFWFYQEGHLGLSAGPLAILKPVIAFTLAGAVLEIIASWLMTRVAKNRQNS